MVHISVKVIKMWLPSHEEWEQVHIASLQFLITTHNLRLSLKEFCQASEKRLSVCAVCRITAKSRFQRLLKPIH